MSRILLVGKGPPERGGIPSFLQALLESSISATHDVTLLNLTRKGIGEGGRFTAGNVRYTLADAFRLLRACANADIVHIHSALAPGSTLLRAGMLTAVARFGGKPVVMHAHGGRIELWLITPGKRYTARLALMAADLVIAVSNGAAEALGTALGSERVRLIDNGVDVLAYGPAGPIHNPPRILFAGGLTARKGVIDLLLASELLVKRGVPHELLLAGGTPNEGKAAEAEVIQAAATASASFLGPQTPEAMPELYRSVDLFCLPSWWEAMPLSVLEAMASGLPVVASRVGNIPSVIKDGVTGHLVPPRQPEKLANALADLLENEGKLRTMGTAARRVAEDRFDLSRTVSALMEMYDEILASAE